MFIISCSPNKTTTRLDSISNFLDSEPERAITELQLLRHELNSPSEKAKYALLMSMAMDRSGIDYTSDSLTSIALAYYNRHGSADEKLKAYYFHSQVFYNAGDNNATMGYLVQAEHLAPKIKDHISLGRVYAVCSDIYYMMIDTLKSLEYAQKSLEQYHQAKDTSRIILAETRLANCFLCADKPDSAKTYLDKLREKQNSLNDEMKIDYYENKLIYDRYYELDSLCSDIDKYFSVCRNHYTDWRLIANCYIAMGKANEAIAALDNFTVYYPEYKDNASYYSLRAEAYDSLGDFRQAYLCHKSYSHLSDSLSMSIYEQDTKYLKERYDTEVLLNNRRLRILQISILSVISILCLIIVVFYFRKKAKRHKKEREDILRKYEELCSEKTALEATLADNDNRKAIGLELLRNRLDVLNTVVSGYINNNGEDIGLRATNAINRLTEDREDFQNSVRSNFNLLYPEFINFLKRQGLDDDDITICCLYCMGLSGKGIRHYTRNSRHYIECLTIREKFGLTEHDTNIGPYLRKMLSELYPDTSK